MKRFLLVSHLTAWTKSFANVFWGIREDEEDWRRVNCVKMEEDLLNEMFIMYWLYNSLNPHLKDSPLHMYLLYLLGNQERGAVSKVRRQ